jgi:hypothetical protein
MVRFALITEIDLQETIRQKKKRKTLNESGLENFNEYFEEK